MSHNEADIYYRHRHHYLHSYNDNAGLFDIMTFYRYCSFDYAVIVISLKNTMLFL